MNQPDAVETDLIARISKAPAGSEVLISASESVDLILVLQKKGGPFQHAAADLITCGRCQLLGRTLVVCGS